MKTCLASFALRALLGGWTVDGVVAELGKPHEHAAIASVNVSTIEGDGSDVTRRGFPCGLFVAMSNRKGFHHYA